MRTEIPMATCSNDAIEKARSTAPNVTQRMIDRFMCYVPL